MHPTRRAMLQSIGGGFGTMVLAGLLEELDGFLLAFVTDEDPRPSTGAERLFLQAGSAQFHT